MFFLKKPGKIMSREWLALNDNFIGTVINKQQIINELNNCFKKIEVWFSDLDDFDTISPAKRIAVRALGTSHFNPNFLWWGLVTLVKMMMFDKKNIESERWKVYYESFLKQDVNHDWLKDDAYEKINQFITVKYVKRLLYPGVLEFYKSFNAKKIMITRNLERIAYRFTRVLPFAGYFHEVQDKGKIVEKYIQENPEIKFYGYGGDSIEDEVAVDVLDLYYKKGLIAKPICLFRADSPSKVNKKFDIFTGKNRNPLVDIISSK